jgi:hypothetical protein
MATPKQPIQKKLQKTKATIDQLSVQLQEECDKYDALMLDLEKEIQETSGIPGLRIVVATGKATRDQVIFDTIRSFRNSNTSYDDIAVKLNVRGLKTKTLDAWTGISVKSFFESFEPQNARLAS